MARQRPRKHAGLSPDETLAASGTPAGTVQVARVPGGETVAELRAHRDAVVAVAFSPDGRLLASGSRDGTVRLWECGDGAPRELLALTFPGPVVTVAFSPDGQQLAVLVHNERGVRLWHLDRLRAAGGDGTGLVSAGYLCRMARLRTSVGARRPVASGERRSGELPGNLRSGAQLMGLLRRGLVEAAAVIAVVAVVGFTLAALLAAALVDLAVLPADCLAGRGRRDRAPDRPRR